MTTKLKNVSLSRDGNAYTARWYYTESFRAADNKRLNWQWRASGAHVNGSTNDRREQSPANFQDYNAYGFTENTRNVTTRAAWWPNTSWRLTGVRFDWTVDESGRRNSGKPNFAIYQPLAPRVSDGRVSAPTVTWSIETRASEMGASSHYAWDTTWWKAQTLRQGQSWPKLDRYANLTKAGFSRSGAGGTLDASYTAPDATYASPLAVRLAVANSGMGGQTVAYGPAHVFARPNAPVLAEGNRNSKAWAWKVKTNANWWHPIDGIALQRLVSSSYDAGGAWESVQTLDMTDSTRWEISAMMDTSQERFPGEDEAVWYRLKTWHDGESNAAYSGNIRADSGRPRAPTAVSGTSDETNITATFTLGTSMGAAVTRMQLLCGGVEVWSGSKMASPYVIPYEVDVTKVYQVRVWSEAYGKASEALTSEDVPGGPQATAEAYNLRVPTVTGVETTADGTGLSVTWSVAKDDADETEVSWSKWADAWESTEEPETHELSAQATGVVIRALTEGVEYHVRVRRNRTNSDGEEVHGAWSALASGVPMSTPSAPVVDAPSAVVPGALVDVSWTFEDEGTLTEQTEAVVRLGDSTWYVEGASQALTITAPEETGTYQLAVSVAAGGGWSDESEAVALTVATAPTLTVAGDGTLTQDAETGAWTLSAMPLSLALASDRADRFDVRVTAVTGASVPDPSGAKATPADAVVAQASVVGSGEVMADGLAGGGEYRATVVAVDSATGLESEPATLDFAVSWANPATPPSATVAVLEDGTTRVTPTAGDGAAETETCRIWRRTSDGPVLAMAGGPFGETYEDRVPVYGDAAVSPAYVIESVSADGDHAWAEVAYELRRETVTIDWDGGGSIELPYDVDVDDRYDKGFQRVEHADGSVTGHWSPAATRGGRVYAATIRGDGETDEALRQLARHSRVCHVRTPDGGAWCANVDVAVSTSHKEASRDVDLDVQAIDDDGTWAIVLAGGEG